MKLIPLTLAEAAKLRPGTKLTCVNTERATPNTLVKGREYTFVGLRSYECGQDILIAEEKCSWQPERFAVSATLLRDARGRFKARGVVILRRERPVCLRNGALYAVKRKNGYVTARLHVGRGDYLVFQVHKKRPFVAAQKQVFYANDEEVKAYLSDPR